MSKYRLVSMLHYGAAALAAAATLMLTTYAAIVVVVVTWGMAAVADRFVNSDEEPDARRRSFVIYTVGALIGLFLILMFSSLLGWWTFVAPVIGFVLVALFDYVVPPARRHPHDPRRYGALPPLTAC